MRTTNRLKSKLPSTGTRVRESTAPQIQERIEQTTRIRMISTAQKGLEAVEKRLRELREEWDTERTLQTNFAVVTLAAVTLGALVARPWFGMLGVVGGFMIQHSLQGWCPPLPIFRRMGFRTMREIDRERYALKSLRGDFREVKRRPGEALRAATVEAE